MLSASTGPVISCADAAPGILPPSEVAAYSARLAQIKAAIKRRADTNGWLYLDPDVELRVVNYASTGDPGFVTDDGRTTYAFFVRERCANDLRRARANEILRRAARENELQLVVANRRQIETTHFGERRHQ